MKSLLLSVAYGAQSLNISSRGCRFAATFPIVFKWLLPIMAPFPRTHAINQLIAPLVWLFGLFRPWRPAALTVTSYVNSSAPDCGPIPHISLRLSVFPFLNQWELPDCSVPPRKRYSTNPWSFPFRISGSPLFCSCIQILLILQQAYSLHNCNNVSVSPSKHFLLWGNTDKDGCVQALDFSSGHK